MHITKEKRGFKNKKYKIKAFSPVLQCLVTAWGGNCEGLLRMQEVLTYPDRAEKDPSLPETPGNGHNRRGNMELNRADTEFQIRQRGLDRKPSRKSSYTVRRKRTQIFLLQHFKISQPFAKGFGGWRDGQDASQHLEAPKKLHFSFCECFYFCPPHVRHPVPRFSLRKDVPKMLQIFATFQKHFGVQGKLPIE